MVAPVLLQDMALQVPCELAPGVLAWPYVDAGPAAAVVAAERCLVELEVAYHRAKHLVVEIAAVA